MNWKAWFFLFRPWSFTATVVPFLVAGGFGVHAVDARWGYWLLGLIAGFFFQSTVNLLNTWGDERSGVDDVPGAIRTTPQVHDGMVSMRALGIVALLCAFLAGFLGLLTCFYQVDGGWRVNYPLLIAGIIGFLGATNYSTGIKFKYRGLGVPFVSVLMGPLEIFVALALLFPEGMNSFWRSGLIVQALTGGLIVSLPIAALVGVIMHGNDMRDIPTDRAAGIVTFASWMGPRAALVYYIAAHLLPYLLITGIALVSLFPLGYVAWSFFLPFLVLPFSLGTIRTALRVYKLNPSSPPWRGLERGSGKIHFLFGVLFALAVAVTS